ncbi:MAG TPA: NAD(P)/FAD-dependent oxidoreductase [Candidatus Aquabacterium excrementipullorum]|nr:NAD(P)/FAD-dependent oxidoreductase [Candidatus Aquabacterium excrementipullorum]
MIETDVVVIGAGPVGLFQVFQLGLLGLRCEVIDVLPEAGGQCVALYPDKPIYDIPGVPVCTGRELAAQLLKQARPFLPVDPATGHQAHLHLGQQVVSLAKDDTAPPAADAPLPYRFTLQTTTGQTFKARAVIVSAGAGAFVPKALPLPGLPADAPSPANLHHHLPADGQPAPWAGQHVIVAGGGDEALQAVLDLSQAADSQRPARITLLHRRDQFQAEPALDTAVRDLIAQGRVELALGVPQGAELAWSDAGTQAPPALTAITVLGPDSQPRQLPLDHLLVRLGLSPKLGPLADWGLPMERKQIPVDTASYATRIDGIHAVGDINTYPGKKRLLLCGFHEATLAAHALLARLRPDEPQHLQYTTTSALLHQRLGVSH